MIALGKNDIKIGNLVVQDKNELIELRNNLMCGSKELGLKSYSLISRNPKVAVGNIPIDMFDRDGNDLIRKKDFYPSVYDVNTGWLFDYIEDVIRFRFLNSVLVFNSLLGELDTSSMWDIPQQFVAKGIIRVSSLQDIWNDCVDSFLLKSSKFDLLVFQTALKENLIHYDIQQELGVKEFLTLKKNHEVVFPVTSDDIRRYAKNSKILGLIKK